MNFGLKLGLEYSDRNMDRDRERNRYIKLDIWDKTYTATVAMIAIINYYIIIFFKLQLILNFKIGGWRAKQVVVSESTS